MPRSPFTSYALRESVFENAVLTWRCLQTVEADGELMTAEPATELPLAQTYFVY